MKNKQKKKKKKKKKKKTLGDTRHPECGFSSGACAGLSFE
jgi:hypothetical protein